VTVFGPVTAARGIDQNWDTNGQRAIADHLHKASRADAFAIVRNEQNVPQWNCREKLRVVFADRSCNFPIAPIWPQLTTGNDALLPRRRSVVDPQVRFNTVVRNQLLKASTWLIPPHDAGECHTCSKPGGDHGNCGCTTQPIFLLVHSNHDARLLGVQLRGVPNQVSIEDEVANDSDVRMLAILKHGM
jgi:hypothetical protein